MNGSRSVWTRPPTRARASSTTGSCPARASSQAATSPAIPAPTTTTFFGRPARGGKPCRAIREQRLRVTPVGSPIRSTLPAPPAAAAL